MKITFTKTNHKGKIASNRKENGGFSNEYAVLVPDTLTDKNHPYVQQGRMMRQVIVARIYYSKGGTCYACVWINAPDNKNRESFHVSGGGKAGGGGYHKPSAALQSALDDAGVLLSENIAGRGENAMQDALSAIALTLGYKKFHIHNAHA